MVPIVAIGPISLPVFGVMLALGWVSVLVALRAQSRWHGLPYTVLYRTTLVAFVTATVGSRVLYAVMVEGTIAPAVLMDYSRGTMYYGFLAGAAAGALGYLTLTRRDPLVVLDACIPAWLFMQISGRIGCFAAGCCYGTPSELPWAVTFPSLHAHALIDGPRHPTQLYEALGVGIIAVLLSGLQRRSATAGVVTTTYLLAYSVLRYLLEYLRDDLRGTVFNGSLSSSQGIAVIVAPLAAVALWYLATRRRTPSLPPLVSEDSP